MAAKSQMRRHIGDRDLRSQSKSPHIPSGRPKSMRGDEGTRRWGTYVINISANHIRIPARCIRQYKSGAYVLNISANPIKTSAHPIPSGKPALKTTLETTLFARDVVGIHLLANYCQDSPFFCASLSIFYFFLSKFNNYCQ